MNVKVFYSSKLVGILQEDEKTDRIYFEYDTNFLKTGIELSFEYLPLRTGVFYNDKEGFDSLPGLFYDSLPDSWGTLLLEREFEKRGISRDNIKPLDKLCYLGNRSIGALSFEPDTGPKESSRLEILNFAKVNREARNIISGKTDEIGEKLIEAGGSAGGARAKILAGISKDGKKFYYAPSNLPQGYEYWLIKLDENPKKQYGILEYIYSLLAKECGIIIPATKLIQTKDDKGNLLSLFSIKRFDRLDDGTRIHTHTLAAMTHYNFNLPGQPYDDLLRRCEVFLRDKKTVHQAFLRMLFNVLFNNCDDHGKNHSFLMNSNGEWTLAPAYDLTFSSGRGKKNLHQMSIEGKRNLFEKKDFYNLGEKYEISKIEVDEMLNKLIDIRKRFKSLAVKYKVDSKRIEEVEAVIKGYTP
jgi:serine/threonine-protein kinase HipA